MDEDQIGFIGVGSMGKPIARRLIDAGYRVAFTSTRQNTVDELESIGATGMATPLFVADQCNILITCLPSDREITDVFLGPEGVIEHLAEGSLIIDLSSASPMILQRVAGEARARNIQVVDAPVSGGTYGAEQGTLTIMVGATDAALARAQPILSAIGQEIFHVGEVGMGKVFKSINNLLTGTTMVLVGEALALAENAGADLAQLYEVVKKSSGDSRVWADIVPKMLAAPENGTPGFRLELMRKDMELAELLAHDLDTSLPLGALAQQFYVSACARGFGYQGAHEIARHTAHTSGARLERTAPDPSDA